MSTGKPRTPLRDASELLAPSVEQAIGRIEGLTEADSGAVHLARRYAAVIDSSSGHCASCDDPDCKRAPGSGWAMRWIGPLLLDCLESLGATPLSRARLKNSRKDDASPSRLHALRSTHQA